MLANRISRFSSQMAFIRWFLYENMKKKPSIPVIKILTILNMKQKEGLNNFNRKLAAFIIIVAPNVIVFIGFHTINLNITN